MNTKGREIAQAFLPFHRTHALVVLGFPQKSLAVKSLKKQKNLCLSFTVRPNARQGRFGGFEARLGSRGGMSKAEESQRIGGE